MIRRAILLLAWITGVQSALAAQVEVTVTGVRDGRGTVRVAICPPTEFLKPVCHYIGYAPAQAGTVVVIIKDVPPGIYAAQAYQDANDNNILDRNWLNLPEEGMGFSNDPPFHFGPPTFADAAFSLTVSNGRISFRLRYY
jgi:uncharacterized protein (DUF2141 family)